MATVGVHSTQLAGLSGTERHMKHSFSTRHSALLLVLATGTLAAAPAMAAQSSAYAVSADLTTDGSSHVQLPPQLPTSGSTTLGQSYDKPVSRHVLAKGVRLLPGLQRGPALTVLAQQVTSDASGSNGVDALNTQGTSTAASGVVALAMYPALPIDPPAPTPLPASAASAANAASAVKPLPLPPLPSLSVQFRQIKSTAQFSQVIPGPTHRSGATQVGEITLSGPLVGGKPLTFKGDIAANTVVVNTPEVKITLNAQVIPQQPVCPPNQVCPLLRVLETVETQAVHVELHNAPVLGHQVSGNIVIGEAEAGQ